MGRKAGRFPRHRAAASLKPARCRIQPAAPSSFPRHRAAASLKRLHCKLGRPAASRFSAASGRGLIEARVESKKRENLMVRFPRHRAAASLKRHDASCFLLPCRSFPRHRAAASLKRGTSPSGTGGGDRVFRGIGPRPH